MSISGIQSSSKQYQIGATDSLQQNFQQLGQALKSGNLSSAQSDFATLKAAFSQPGASSGNTTSSTSESSTAATTNSVNQAFNQLASDLKSGNLSAAQKDYSTIRQNVPSIHGTVMRNRLHAVDQSGNGVSTGQNLPSSTSTPATAQQGYAALQQELQQFALSGTTSLAVESPVSFDV